MNSEAGTRPDVAIVGAGIIGIAVAAYLAEAGLEVVVFDRSGICEETSSGNAAALAFSDVLPLAHKGMARKLPGWMADPLGPLSIPPAYLPQLLPWLIRFWRAGSSRRREASLVAQAGLMQLARSEWMELMQRAGLAGMLREDGSLELYDSEREFRASLPGWGARTRFGIEHHHLAGEDLRACQPGLAPRFVRGTFVPGWRTVTDPQWLGKALWQYAKGKGARFVAGLVSDVGGEAGGVAVQLRQGPRFLARFLVVAAGAWSHRLASRFGDRIPLETERGYNTTLPASAFDLRRMLVFPGHGFVATPLEGRLRIGGAVELGGLERRPDFRRARAMLAKAQSFLPGLDPRGGVEWMGFRPSLPDSLPAIGRASGHHNVVYAFGHGHLGLTQAAATGRLIRDLVLGRSLPIDASPFLPQRF